MQFTTITIALFAAVASAGLIQRQASCVGTTTLNFPVVLPPPDATSTVYEGTTTVTVSYPCRGCTAVQYNPITIRPTDAPVPITTTVTEAFPELTFVCAASPTTTPPAKF